MKHFPLRPQRPQPAEENQCGPCQQRRQMIAEARQSAGLPGVMRALPMIARDIVKNPPKIGKKRNG